MAVPPPGSGDPQEQINKIILVVGYVTLIDRQMKFINLWNSSRTGIDKVDWISRGLYSLYIF